MSETAMTRKKSKSNLAGKPRKARPASVKRHHLHVAFDTNINEPSAFSANQNLVQEATTPNFVISYDSRLGPAGPVLANYFAQCCEFDFQSLGSIFGTQPQNLPFHVNVVYSAAGAWHPAPCSNSTIFVGALSANPTDPLFLRSLLLSELIEIFSADPGTPWACDKSHGEALSRVLADALVQCNRPANFVSAPIWLNSPRADWVDKTEDTDRDFYSIGCGVLFLNWLRVQLQFSWNKIVASGGPTLAQTYQSITGKSDGWQSFRQLLDAHFPVGQPANVSTDNVFPL
jgi:hypothetical protein